MYMKVLLAAASALALAGSAQAQVAVSIWTGTPAATTAAANATLAQASTLGTPTATTTVGAINFDSLGSANYTIGGFLNNPILSNPSIATNSLNNTYMLFTGQLFLNAGSNSFVVSHDDGLQLNIDGLTPSLVVDAPGPTSPTDTPFNVMAPSSGLYNFELSYGETAGPPAVLKFAINGAPVGSVPEPATWGMMLLGFAGIGLTVRNRRRRPIAQIA